MTKNQKNQFFDRLVAMKASITYTVTTRESAEHGDYAESGWYMPGDREYPLEDSEGRHESVLSEARAGDFDLEIDEAIREAQNLGAVHEIEINGSKVRAYSVDPPNDRAYFERGEERYYTVHVEAGTPLRAQLVAAALAGR